MYMYFCVCIYSLYYIHIYLVKDTKGRSKVRKRPITVSKETYYSVKRDLLQCQKRPITLSKTRKAALK